MQRSGNNNGHTANLHDRTKSQELAQWLNPAVFSLARASRLGTDVRQPGRRNVDLSLFKSFKVRERRTAMFRAEAFNELDTAQFGAAIAQVGNTNFGVISSTAVSPRRSSWR